MVRRVCGKVFRVMNKFDYLGLGLLFVVVALCWVSVGF